MNVIKNIEVFGDSILKGIQINPLNQRYYVDNHIDQEISEARSLHIENFSRFGCTITKGWSLLEKRLRKGICCDTIVMNYGGNDCDFNWKEIAERPQEPHLPHTPLDLFTAQYRKIIRTLKERGIQPILTTLPPLIPQKFFDWFCRGLNLENIMTWLGDVGTIYRFQENYSRTVEQIARETQVPLVDLRGAFLHHRTIDHLFCEDGTHPNTAGQQLITSAFLAFAETFRLDGGRMEPVGV